MAISKRTVAVVCLVSYGSCACLCSQEAEEGHRDFYDNICRLAVDLGRYESHGSTDTMISMLMRIAHSFNHDGNEVIGQAQRGYPYLARLAQCAVIQTPHSALLRSEIIMVLADEEKRKGLAEELFEIVRNGMLTKLYENMTDFSACVIQLTAPEHGGLVRSHKGKKRKSTSSVFGALASTCVQLGNIIGIVRPESRAVLSLFGVALNVVSRVIQSKQKRNSEQPPEEQELVVMTKEEFSAHVLALLQSAHNGIQGQDTLQNQEQVATRKGFNDSYIPADNTSYALLQISNQFCGNLCAMLEDSIERIQQYAKVE